MFEFINDESERGQVGIGTLIVFIAMVLVAAIAAGVLINTAGFLQSQAEATGEDSSDLVSERIDVTSTVGIVSGDHDDGNLSEVRLGVSGAAGSDQIDLSETTIEAVGPDGQENLVFQNHTGNDTSDIGTGEFAVQEDDEFVGSDSAVLDGEDKLTIVLNPASSPFEHDGHAFGEGEKSSLDIVSPSSATTSTELTTPDLYSTDDEAVRL